MKNKCFENMKSVSGKMRSQHRLEVRHPVRSSFTPVQERSVLVPTELSGTKLLKFIVFEKFKIGKFEISRMERYKL